MPSRPADEHDGEGQVDVAARVGRAQLDARGPLLAGLVAGDADVGRAVLLAPGDVDRGLVAFDQTLVGVDPLAVDGEISRAWAISPAT